MSLMVILLQMMAAEDALTTDLPELPSVPATDPEVATPVPAKATATTGIYSLCAVLADATSQSRAHRSTIGTSMTL
jgi:hypothetical protein